jgi:hypothetical protein
VTRLIQRAGSQAIEQSIQFSKRLQSVTHEACSSATVRLMQSNSAA